MVYLREPPVVAGFRVVGPFPGQKPLPLLREVLDLLHDLTARHRFAFLSGIACGDGRLVRTWRGPGTSFPPGDAQTPNLLSGQFESRRRAWSPSGMPRQIGR